MTTTSTHPTGSNGTSSTTTPEPAASKRERIKAKAGALAKEQITVPHWDETVEVRAMSIETKSVLYDQAAGDNAKLSYFLPGVIVATCYDPDTGEPMFEEADIEWLATEPAGVIEDVAGVGLRLSGMTEAGVSSEALAEGKGAS